MVALSWIAHPEWFSAEVVQVDLVVNTGRRPDISVVPSSVGERTVTLPMGMADKEAYWTWIAESVSQ